MGLFEWAIGRLSWCSSDAVCVESYGKATDCAHIVKFHDCVLMPESTCHSGNRLLDRGLLAGTRGFLGIDISPDISLKEELDG